MADIKFSALTAGVVQANSIFPFVVDPGVSSAASTATPAAIKTGLALVSSDVGLGSVTNDAQTKLAVVPNTLPATGQILVGNAGGTAYAPVTMSGDATLSSTGALSLSGSFTNLWQKVGAAVSPATITDNVGIGTTAPLSGLDVSSGIAVGAYAATNAAPANSIIVSSKIGVGDPSPAYPVTVKSAADYQAMFYGYSVVAGAASNGRGSIRIGSDLNDYARLDFDSAGQTTFYIDSAQDSTAAALKIRMRTSGTPVIPITCLGSGFVGVKTTPLALFHIESGNLTSTFGLGTQDSISLTQGGSANALSQVGFGYCPAATQMHPAAIAYVNTDASGATKGDLIFGTRSVTTDTAPTVVMRIDSNLNVGIGGTANANAQLDVQSTTKAFMPPRMTTTQKNAIASPTAGMVVYDSTLNQLSFYNGSLWSVLAQSNSKFTFCLGDGATVITTGAKKCIEVTQACTITGWKILSDDASTTAGDIVIDIWKDTYANYPPTVADTIINTGAGGVKPTITATNTKGISSSVANWTTSLAAGDILRFNVDSVNSLTSITLILEVTLT